MPKTLKEMTLLETFEELQSEFELPDHLRLKYIPKPAAAGDALYGWVYNGQTSVHDVDVEDILVGHANQVFKTTERKLKDVLTMMRLSKATTTDKALKVVMEGWTDKWRPGWVFQDAGDMAMAFWENCATTAKWISPYLTVFYKDDDESKIVGVQLMGVYHKVSQEFEREAQKHTKLAIAVRDVCEAAKEGTDHLGFLEALQFLEETYQGKE